MNFTRNFFLPDGPRLPCMRGMGPPPQVMDKKHLREQNYEAQVAQEVAILRTLDHPAVSRTRAPPPA